MTFAQSQQLRKTARALDRAETALRNATDETVAQAASEYLNAYRAHQATIAACAPSA